MLSVLFQTEWKRERNQTVFGLVRFLLVLVAAAHIYFYNEGSGNFEKAQMIINDLLCPQLYQQLATMWPAASAVTASVDSALNSLLTPPPISTLRVNTLKCTSTSDALAEAEECLGIKGYIHHNFPDILVFPRHQQPSDALKQADEAPGEGRASSSLPAAKQEDGSLASAHLSFPMVIVGAQCGQSVLRGSHVFAPGVLAAEKGIREGDLVGIWTLPRPFRHTDIRNTASTTEWDTTNSLRSINFLRGAYLQKDSRQAVEKSGVFCGLGRLVQPLKGVFLGSKGVAIEVQGANDLSSLPPSLVAQQLPSIVVGHVLAPVPGERVIDLCAAPGHKTAHIASLMRNQGLLLAIDRSKRRLQEMEALLERLGASMVECIHGDSAKGRWKCSLGGPAELQGTFDRVLADVTCTGLGLRPRIVFDNVDATAVAEASKYQREFIARACELLKPGGVLVYSTCSISWEENEGNVLWAVDQLPLELEPAKPFYVPNSPSLRDPQNKWMLQRFCPSGETIGFFIAKLRKQDEAKTDAF